MQANEHVWPADRVQEILTELVVRYAALNSDIMDPKANELLSGAGNDIYDAFLDAERQQDEEGWV
jgi:hypothetical protein